MEKSGIVYECMRCGARVPSEELSYVAEKLNVSSADTEF